MMGELDRRPDAPGAGEDVATLRGLAVRLCSHLNGLRRRVDGLGLERLQEELALAGAALESARGVIGEERIARRADEGRELVAPRDVKEIDARAGYALWSETYDDEMNPVIRVEEPVLGDLLGDVRGKRVLDVGCGTGRWAVKLAAQGAHVTAVDPNRKMLEKARKSASDASLAVEFVDGELGTLPEFEPFDVALCNLVLCHVPQVAGPVAEMAGLLKPGGRLVISDFHYLCQVIGWRTAFTSAGQRYHIENYIHDYGEFLRAFLDAGLSVTAIREILVDEVMRGEGTADFNWNAVLDPWMGFPLCMVIAGVNG